MNLEAIETELQEILRKRQSLIYRRQIAVRGMTLQARILEQIADEVVECETRERLLQLQREALDAGAVAAE